ncbi:MAG: hypothetical protein U9Q38_02650, partial [Thermodesulfobacteriota bacterium]|nr:hypothetical protein [Thermodesulfobacteriota bacterium]
MWYNLNNLSMGETPSHIKYISRRQLYPVIDFRYSRDPLHIRQFLSEVDGKFYISYYPPPFKYIYFPKNKAIKILYTSLLKKSNISEDQVFKNVYRLMWEYASKDKYHRYDGAYIYGDITTNSYCYDNYVHFPGYSLKVGDDSESYATPCVEGNSAYKESWYTNKIYNVDQLNSSGGEHYNDYHPFINSPDYYARSGTPQVGVVYSGTDIPYKRTTDVHYPRYYPQSIAPHVWSSTDLLGKYEWDSTSIDLADSFFWGQSLHGYASDKFFGIRKIKLKTSDDSLISYGYEFPSGPTNTFIPFYLTGPLKGRCLLLFYRTIPRGEGFSYLETSQMFPSDILKDSPWLNKEDYQDEYEYWANLMYHSSPLTGGVIFPISF